MKLVARLENGSVVEGESQIPEESIKQNSRIKQLMIEPKDAKPLKDALKAIEEADAIVLGPGSLYTSVIPNLLVKDISDYIRKSDAIKIYISNIMTQPGETHGFRASDHIKVLKKYGGRGIVNYVIANRGDIPEDVKEKYLKDGSQLVELDSKELKSLGVEVIEASLAKIEKGYVKHDSEYLAEVLVDTIMEKKLLYDRKKIIEYMYVSQKIKERDKKSKKI